MRRADWSKLFTSEKERVEEGWPAFGSNRLGEWISYLGWGLGSQVRWQAACKQCEDESFVCLCDDGCVIHGWVNVWNPGFRCTCFCVDIRSAVII